MLIHKFVVAIFWRPKADEMGAKGRGTEGRWPRVEEHKHPVKCALTSFNTTLLSHIYYDLKK